MDVISYINGKTSLLGRFSISFYSNQSLFMKHLTIKNKVLLIINISTVYLFIKYHLKTEAFNGSVDASLTKNCKYKLN